VGLRYLPGLAEDALDRILRDARIKVPVAATLVISLMTDEIVDDPLINCRAREGRYEAMAKHVVTPQGCPLRTRKCSFEVIVRLMLGQRK
jgi:hypothetical protein